MAFWLEVLAERLRVAEAVDVVAEQRAVLAAGQDRDLVEAHRRVCLDVVGVLAQPLGSQQFSLLTRERLLAIIPDPRQLSRPSRSRRP